MPYLRNVIQILMRFTDDDTRRIKDASTGKLLDVISDFHELRKRGKGYVCDCPRCHAHDKFEYSPAKGIFKCWSCSDVGGTDAIGYLMKAENM